MAGWLMAWVMTLAGCSADALSEETPDNGTGEVMSNESYINLRIVNNSQPQTRTTEAATEAENAIYDGILVFFVGNGETVASLKSAVVIDQLINNPGTTASVDVVQRTPLNLHPYPASGSGKIYVLALLNTTSTGFTVRNNMLYLNSTSLSDYTRSQLQNSVINSIGSLDRHVGLYMASKPKGTGSTPEQTAIQIYDPGAATPSAYLYDNPADITPSSGKLTLNVERAAAKVKVTNGISTNALTSINLDGNSSRHPKVHNMTWAVNKYNTESYALNGGSGHTFTPVKLAASGYSGASDFAVYQQRSHQSGDAEYIAENTSTPETEVIVEVQLKDGSFLMDDCYAFFPLDDGGFRENTFHDLYTSASQFVAYLKSGWGYQKGNYYLSDRSADDIFENMKLELADNGAVTVTFTMDTFGYSSDELTGLTNLKTFLEGHTRGFKNGKMYYTFSIPSIDRNNAYNLMLQTSSITAIGRPTP